MPDIHFSPTQYDIPQHLWTTCISEVLARVSLICTTMSWWGIESGLFYLHLYRAVGQEGHVIKTFAVMSLMWLNKHWAFSHCLENIMTAFQILSFIKYDYKHNFLKNEEWLSTWHWITKRYIVFFSFSRINLDSGELCHIPQYRLRTKVKGTVTSCQHQQSSGLIVKVHFLELITMFCEILHEYFWDWYSCIICFGKESETPLYCKYCYRSYSWHPMHDFVGGMYDLNATIKIRKLKSFCVQCCKAE